MLRLLLRVRKHTQNNYCLVLVVCFFLLIGFTFSLNESLARTLPFYIYIYILVMYNYRASWECVRLTVWWTVGVLLSAQCWRPLLSSAIVVCGHRIVSRTPRLFGHVVDRVVVVVVSVGVVVVVEI